MLTFPFKKAKAIFIPFIMAGYPSLEASYKAILALTEANADIIELGVPFSDPIADGPVNLHAAEVALKNGVNLDKVFALVSKVRAKNITIPIVLFTYYNPVLAYGEDNFIRQAKKHGIDGVLIVDLPPEEGKEFYSKLRKNALGFVLLVAPTTAKKRFALYKSLRPSFLYYISRLAVTGAQQSLSTTLRKELQELKRCFPKTNCVVGFGISTPLQAKEVAKYADGIVVGSKLVQTLAGEGEACFKQLALSFTASLN